MLKACPWHAEYPQSTLRSSTILYLTFIDVDFAWRLLYNYLSLNMPQPRPLSFDKCFSPEFTSSPLTRIPRLLPKAIAPGSNLIMNAAAVYTLPAFVPVIKTMLARASRPRLMEHRSKHIHLITGLSFQSALAEHQRMRLMTREQ